MCPCRISEMLQNDASMVSSAKQDDVRNVRTNPPRLRRTLFGRTYNSGGPQKIHLICCVVTMLPRL